MTYSNISKTSNTTEQGQLTVDPVSGQFEITERSTSDNSIRNAYPNIDIDTTLSVGVKDYSEQFEQKQEKLAGIVSDTGELRKGEVADLLMTANKCVWQESQ